MYTVHLSLSLYIYIYINTCVYHMSAEELNVCNQETWTTIKYKTLLCYYVVLLVLVLSLSLLLSLLYSTERQKN